MRRNIFLIFFVFFILALTVSVPGCRNGKKAVKAQNDSIPAMGFWPDSLDAVEGTVKGGEVFTDIMTSLGMDYGSAVALADTSKSVFDVKTLKAGNRFWAYYESDTASDGQSSRQLQYVVYEMNQFDMTIFSCTPPFSARHFSKPVKKEIEGTDVTISSSLWNDMVEAGTSPMLILSLSDIYAWSVDFFGLQEGDRFRVLFQQTECEGNVVSIDSIYYAEFIRDSLVIPAVYFDQGDGGNTYWSQDGKSLKKAFLKAPLKFTRISSGFSYHRRHPVTGRVKPHTAIDYAAPKGTPVMTIGDGTVLSAGWSGAGGNMVKIRHNSEYTTAYLHFSRYARGIRSGAKVHQGDVIGYVGATGMATGPHLDFRVWKNGTPVNPLKLVSPPSDPLKKEFLPALDSASTRYRHLLDSLSAR